MLIYQNYYKDPGVRNICHEIKEAAGNQHAVIHMAEYLVSSGIANKDSILIPAPQHSGQAEYTLKIAEYISEKIGCMVCDVLSCTPHAPLYDMKYLNTCPDITFMAKGDVSQNKSLLFIDNVISTGYTYNKCNALLDNRLIPFVYAVDYTRMPLPVIEKEYEGYVILQKNGRLALERKE